MLRDEVGQVTKADIEVLLCLPRPPGCGFEGRDTRRRQLSGLVKLALVADPSAQSQAVRIAVRLRHVRVAVLRHKSLQRSNAAVKRVRMRVPRPPRECFEQVALLGVE
jgi:hypothetical protein